MKHNLYYLCILLIFLFSLSLSGCNNEQESTKESDHAADSSSETVLVEPIPTEGKVVATIQGEEYKYDADYLFRVTMTPKWNDFTKDHIYEAVYRELVAIEGRNNSNKSEITEKTLSEQVELYKEYYFNPSYREGNKENAEYLNKFLNQKGMTSEEFWESQKPFVLKHEYFREEIFRIWDRFEQDMEQDPYGKVYIQENRDQLFEKYNVKILASFE